jgi:hypothetical protein
MAIMSEREKLEATEPTHRAHELGARVVGFVRRRPLISLGLLAGAGALGGVELAAGALVGLGAAALFATPAGRELRHDIADRARRLLEEHQPPHASPPT